MPAGFTPVVLMISAAALMQSPPAPAAKPDKPDAKRIEEYRAAADRGSVDAMFNLGVLHAEGRGTLRDDVRAVEWYRAAAERGHAAAMYNLATMLEQGRGTPADLP